LLLKNNCDIYADLDKYIPLPIHENAGHKATKNLGSDISSQEYKFWGTSISQGGVRSPNCFGWGKAIEENVNQGYCRAQVAARRCRTNYKCDDDPQTIGNANRKESCYEFSIQFGNSWP
jgi:hypothetical protein